MPNAKNLTGLRTRKTAKPSDFSKLPTEYLTMTRGQYLLSLDGNAQFYKI